MSSDQGFEEVLAKGKSLLQQGKPSEARIAVNDAVLARVPEAFFIVGMSQLAEEDFALADVFLRMAEEGGYADATSARQLVQARLLAHNVENQQALQVEIATQSKLANQQAFEGTIPLRDGWWINWYPKSDTKQDALLAATAYIMDLNWQIDHRAIEIAKKNDLIYFKDLSSRLGGEMNAAEILRKDSGIAQRSLGFRGATDVMDMLIPQKLLKRQVMEMMPTNEPLKFLASSIPEFVDLYSEINPAAMPRFLTLIPYLMMPTALSLSDHLQQEASYYYSKHSSNEQPLSNSGGAKRVPTGLISREKIMDSKLLDLEGFEIVGGYEDFCPQLFPEVRHKHHNAEWPRRGWQRNSQGGRNSGCDTYFENGQWKCLKAGQQKKVVKAKSPRVPAKKSTTTNPSTSIETKQAQASDPWSKNLLISLAASNKLPFTLPPEPWFQANFSIGPVPAQVITMPDGLTFIFDLGKYESTQSANAIVEVMANRNSIPGSKLSYSLEPKPRIKLEVKLSVTLGESDRIVEFALAQTADLAIEQFKIGIISDYLLEPNQNDLIKFGLVPETSANAGSVACSNWTNSSAGTKILFRL